MEPLDNNQNPQWTPTKKFFSETILVALLTGVGYLVAFAYQYSYLKYFNIPTIFIDINLGLILLTTSVGLTWLIAMAMIFNFFVRWKPDKKLLKITKAASLYIVLLVGIMSPMIATIYDPSNVWPFLAMFFAILIGLLISVIILYINPKLLDKTEGKRNKNDLLYKAEQIYGSFPILFVVILLYLILCSGAMGTVIARNTTEYLVSNTNPKLIIISTYSDSFIGLTFNASTHKFNKEIIPLNKDNVSENNIIFSFEEIGRLTSN